MNTKLFLSLTLLTSFGALPFNAFGMAGNDAIATAAAVTAIHNLKVVNELSAMNYLDTFVSGSAAQAPQWADFVDGFCELLPQSDPYNAMRKAMMSTRDLKKGFFNKKRIADALMAHKDLIPQPIKAKMRALGMGLSSYIKLK